MSNELETTYRRALRWYPKRWRGANEDALIGTLMEQAADERRTIPAPGEMRNLRHSAIRTRLEVFGRLITPAARGHATVITLGIGAAISAAGLYFSGLGWVAIEGSYHQVFTLPTLGHNLLAGQIAYVVWLLVLIAVLARLRRLARVLLVAFVPISVAWSLIAESLGVYGHPSSISVGYLDLLALVALPGIGVASRRHRRSVAISAGTSLVVLIATYLLRGYGGGYWGNGATNIDYFWEPLAVWMIFAGIPASLTLAVVLFRLKQRAIADGILLAGAPVIYLGLFSIGYRSDAMTTVGVVIGVFVAIAVVLGLLRLLGIRVTITRA